MLQLRSRQSQIRKRNTAHKVYVPKNARDNQYILLEFSPNDILIEKAYDHALPSHGFDSFYRFISNEFFKLCYKYNLTNAHFIAKNKLIKVRFSDEAQVIETEQQVIFFYNPQSHTAIRTFYDKNKLTKKIQLLFLATGSEIRENAAHFHIKILNLMHELSDVMSVPLNKIKIKDHQHLTFDLFSTDKNDKATKTHGFRKLVDRYYQQALPIPQKSKNQTFSIASLPINTKLLQQFDIDITTDEPYKMLYQHISDLFIRVAKSYQLEQLVMVANAKTPVLRQTENNFTSIQTELVHLGLSSHNENDTCINLWDSTSLVGTINLIFIATDTDLHKRSYGKFVNNLMLATKEIATTLGYEPKSDTLILRFYQHLSYRDNMNLR
ncbi:DUF3083 family protein [Pseudoalteromonas denitrificans]|uniref:DUF3083 domain-containing protein n=1 Tax=Pseudoalteromonas denitrificans DSM 6059 TaxID=1123010 RepID=A0A1I1Q8U2_9GAMM|nr:DUF3083 family protein [Pseudoalteromonas denitrificans]SFD18531.1 Protein of unknown function [Pseudoalteromonas denitrificans DSM 6059]